MAPAETWQPQPVARSTWFPPREWEDPRTLVQPYLPEPDVTLVAGAGAGAGAGCGTGGGDAGVSGVRLLPWSGADGRPCVLRCDDGSSFLWRLADGLESVQLGMAEDVLKDARDALREGSLSETGVRHLVHCLCMSLTDVLRVAESRGARLPVPDDDGDGELSRAARAVVDREIALSDRSGAAPAGRRR